MPNTKASSDAKPKTDDKKTVISDSQTQQTAKTIIAKAQKEIEPPDFREGEILKEVQERSREADLHAEQQVQKELGKEARLREPEVIIPKDVAEAGVISPEKEATKTLKEGPTIDLAITEEAYKRGQNTQLASNVTQKKEVYGVSGIIAFCIAIGRMIKKAHHLAKNVRFKKSSSVETSEDMGK